MYVFLPIESRNYFQRFQMFFERSTIRQQSVRSRVRTRRDNKQICKEPLNHDNFSLIRNPTNCSDNYRRAIPRLITSAPALWSAAMITTARRSPRHCFLVPLLGFQFPSINISSTKALAWDSSWHCPLKIVSYGRTVSEELELQLSRGNSANEPPLEN